MGSRGWYGDCLFLSGVLLKGLSSVWVILGSSLSFAAVDCEPMVAGIRAFDVGDQLVGLSSGDFDSDGLTDLVQLSLTDSAIAIRLGDGRGDFPRLVSIPVDPDATYLVSGDLDGDQNLDLIVSAAETAGPSFISVFLGNGDATFSMATSFEIGSQSTHMHLADLDGDTDLDLVVFRSAAAGERFDVLLGVGDGTFQPRVEYLWGAAPVRSTAVGDFDNDGNPDVVGGSNNFFRLMRNRGDGTFAPTVNWPFGVSIYRFVVGNIDQDPNLDLLAEAQTGDPIVALLGRGDGTFDVIPAQSGTRGGYELLDLNEDGVNDLLTWRDFKLYVQEGDGQGSFGNASETWFPRVYGVAWGDWNRDGRADLAATLEFGLVASVLGNGDGTFLGVEDIPGTAGANEFRMEDLNGDGLADMVLCDYGSRFRVFLGTGGGAYSLGSERLLGGRGEAMTLIDLDLDGISDVVIALSSGNVMVLIGGGNGSFALSGSYPVGGPAFLLAVDDINGDGFPDVVVGGQSSVAILRGNGDGTLRPPSLQLVQDVPVSLALGDFDADSASDLAIGFDSYLEIYMNDGSGSFGVGVSYPMPGGPVYVASDDLERDGDDDLVAAHDGSLTTLLSDGSGGVQFFTVPGRGNPQGISLGELNGDGLPDVAVADEWDLYSPDHCVVYHGTTSGIPAPEGRFILDVRSEPIRIGDYDSDGTADLVIGGTQVLVNRDTPCSDEARYLVGQGAGLGNPCRFRTFDVGGAQTVPDVFAYSGLDWGVSVAAGDINQSATVEGLTGPGPGPLYGPQLRGFFDSGSPIQRVSFYAYGTLRFGVNPAAGDLEGDGFEEILSGAGSGAVFGPHVRGWDYDGGPLGGIARINYFAYSTLRFGVGVAGGDVDGDSREELVTGPGPGPTFAPTVRGWDFDGAPLAAISKINFNAGVERYGTQVGGGDVDDDGFAEIVCSPGAGPTNLARLRGFQYDDVVVLPATGFDLTPTPTLYGGRLALGDATGDGVEDLAYGSGPDPAAPGLVGALLYDGASLVPHQATPFLAFPSGYGINLALSDR